MTRQNGESIAMGELDYYKISYGKDQNSWSNEVRVDGAAEYANVTHVIEGLSDGTWWFAVSVFDTAGLSSVESAIVSKIIGENPPPT